MSVKESKEIVVALVKLYKEIAILAKDGIQPKDGFDLVVAIASKPELRNALLAAVQGASLAPAEWSPVEFGDIAEIVQAVVAELKA